MALTPLVPWPTSAAALINARERVEKQAISAKDDEIVDSICEATAEVIQKYAPLAPQAVKDEAFMRLAAYMHSKVDLVTRERDGEMEMEYDLNASALFRRCGAQGLLSPWKIRRAGAIG